MALQETKKKEVNTSCGYTKACRPKWLQAFSNAKAFLVVMTACTITQGFAINGINNSNTVMYERRYELSSRVTSLVTVFEDLAGALVVILVGYYGSTRHKPRLMACSFTLMCIGLFIMCLAQFASPPYDPIARSQTTRNGSTTKITRNEAETEQQSVKHFVILLIIGQILNGFTGTSLFTLGLAFLEASTSAASAALYIGIAGVGSVLGPAIGFLAGGQLLEVYVDYPAPAPLGLTSSDPAWVGAWWIGFLIAIIFSVILAMILCLFPREFPDTAVIAKAKVSEAHDNGTEGSVSQPGFGMSWKDLPKATWYLLKNSCFMCLTIAVSAELGTVVAFSTFFPKLLIVQFRISPRWASSITGLALISAAVLGQLFTGCIIKKLNLSVRQILKMVLTAVLLCICILPVYLARCPTVKFAGVNVDYTDQEVISKPALMSGCNRGRACTTATYEPLCSNDVQYFSPCHAGCTHRPFENETQIYKNCSCIQYSANTTVTNGQCKLDCPLLYSVFLPLIFLLYLLSPIISTSLIVTAMRVVSPELRSYSVAVNCTFVKFLGSIPGPFLYGAIIDTSCSIWQDKNGSKGSCWAYDNQKLSLRTIGYAAGMKIISALFCSLALVLYKAPAADAKDESDTSVADIADAAKSSSL